MLVVHLHYIMGLYFHQRILSSRRCRLRQCCWRRRQPKAIRMHRASWTTTFRISGTHPARHRVVHRASSDPHAAGKRKINRRWLACHANSNRKNRRSCLSTYYFLKAGRIKAGFSKWHWWKPTIVFSTFSQRTLLFENKIRTSTSFLLLKNCHRIFLLRDIPRKEILAQPEV